MNAKRNGDDSRIPEDWYCNAALILRGRRKDIEKLVESIIPELTESEEVDFDVKVFYVCISHGRFDIRKKPQE